MCPRRSARSVARVESPFGTRRTSPTFTNRTGCRRAQMALCCLRGCVLCYEWPDGQRVAQANSYGLYAVVVTFLPSAVTAAVL